VDHTLYDHTSILRFIEWRFLGAPAKGTSGRSGRWWLTKRDRHAHPIGQTLVTERVNSDIPDPLIPPDTGTRLTPPCEAVDKGGVDPFRDIHPTLHDEIARDHAPATHRLWESRS
jgi:hypothetical protein